MMEQWKIIYSNQSRVDLLNIDNYIRYDLLSPMAANRITDKFLNMIKNLNSMPKRYPLYPEEPWYSLGLRYFPVENYIVFYYPEDNKQIVQIIRIMYSGQDISGNLPTKLNNQKRASFFDRCSFFAWEQRKLGDLAEIVRGASPRPISDPKWFDDNSDIGWLRISDVTNQNGRIYYLEQHISKLGQEKTRVITEPHLLLSIAATVGKPLINYIKTGVHDGFLIFLNPKFDLEYMYQWLEMFRPKWNKYGQPGSQVNLNSNLVRKQKIALPSREEQQRISSFLKQLDSLIALHQRKVKYLISTSVVYL